MHIAEPLFWLSIAAILYTYAGYPLVIWAVGRIRSRRVNKSEITPRVSVVIACHNEAGRIEARIANILESDYPAELLETIVVSDGSTDDTVATARRCASARVRVFGYDRRMGKATALNVGMEMATGDIVVFADARQAFDPRAIKELAANFADESVGAVSGELMLDNRDTSSVSAGVGVYWEYEKWIRKSESRFNSVIGATGAIYAIRRELWKPLPASTILDDIYTPMQIALGGRRVIFEEQALAYDYLDSTTSREFSRKVRTLTGNYQLCQLMPRLLVPTSALLFQFYSHKLMRLAAPLFFLVLFSANVSVVASLALAGGSASGAKSLLYQASLVAQVAFYASVLAGGWLSRHNRKVRLLNFAYVFSMMNAAALVGLFYFIRGKRDIWAVNQRVKVEG
ncbi:MAG TPA: glycosyltransferase family 2 protein [Blastocatellia bacterium]|nr:glycosyltransferase family 2 protein [Blastocatellia bacterium]